MTSVAELNRLDEELCQEAEKFSRAYYDAMDRKREKIAYLYCEDRGADLPTLVWNGNAIEGQDNIVRFLSSLPETDHRLVSIDAQRIPDEISCMTGCMVVTTAGSITVGGVIHAFSQTFTLVTADDDRLRVKSNRLRYVD